MKITIKFYIFKLIQILNFSFNHFDFWRKFPKKVYFLWKSEKNEHHHRILHIQITLSTNFQLKLTVAIFWIKFAHKGQLFSGTKFHLKLTILIFLTRFTQTGFFWSRAEKVNTTYFLHNSAYLNQSSAKFQLKLAVLIFWANFAQKSISSQKQKK